MGCTGRTVGEPGIVATEDGVDPQTTAGSLRNMAAQKKLSICPILVTSLMEGYNPANQSSVDSAHINQTSHTHTHTHAHTHTHTACCCYLPHVELELSPWRLTKHNVQSQ